MMMGKRMGNYLIVVGTIAFYTLIGHLFSLDVLKIMTFGIDEFSISFVGMIICFVTVVFIQAIINFYKKKNQS